MIRCTATRSLGYSYNTEPLLTRNHCISIISKTFQVKLIHSLVLPPEQLPLQQSTSSKQDLPWSWQATSRRRGGRTNRWKTGSCASINIVTYIMIIIICNNSQSCLFTIYGPSYNRSHSLIFLGSSFWSSVSSISFSLRDHCSRQEAGKSSASISHSEITTRPPVPIWLQLFRRRDDAAERSRRNLCIQRTAESLKVVTVPSNPWVQVPRFFKRIVLSPCLVVGSW